MMCFYRKEHKRKVKNPKSVKLNAFIFIIFTGSFRSLRLIGFVSLIITSEISFPQEAPRNYSGVFMTPEMRNTLTENAIADTTAEKAMKAITERADPWMKYSYDQLWQMMFANTIKRSWMVWSDGYCPACKKGVPMYTWIVDPLNKPWKVTCPHCLEDFPKNDFEKFYRSGINDTGTFDPVSADRSLLFNTEHPDSIDPLHGFGVDDGNGWYADGHRWRFIGAYLIYGQWKELIVKGITNLSEAYVVTGDEEYARRAGIMLDRVADLYPSHDFGKQGLVYENPGMAGYVSTWHDACQETRELAIAYDMIREALAHDKKLADFLAAKAEKYKSRSSKSTPEDIIRNIENGIIKNPQLNRGRIYSNYPQTDMTLAILKRIENTPASVDSARIIIDSLIAKATSADGLTGEKGLTGYSAYGAAKMADFLSLFSRSDKKFLPAMIDRHPSLTDMYRFYTDTWCGMRYYPNIGDCDAFALPDTVYKGVYFSKEPGLKPSMYTFLWELYKITGEKNFVKVIYNENGSASEGLPYDIFVSSPEKVRKETDKVIKRHGHIVATGTVNKENWHLAILKKGSGRDERAFWIDYDAGGYHSHSDGLNIGLFAYGLDLLPDFGYPPVQFGGWQSEKAKWYTMTAAHNTIVVDGRDQQNLAGKYQETKGFMGEPAGKINLLADGSIFQAVSADIPEAYNIPEYRRTDAVISSENNFYIIDIFNVTGGSEHARMTYTLPGDMKIRGINPQKGNAFGHGTMLKNFMTDSLAKQGWSADWTIDDRHHLSTEAGPVHLRLTDFTDNVSVSSAEAWITSGFSSTEGEWIPSLVTRRTGNDSLLSSVFISVIEPYVFRPFIQNIRKPVSGKNYIALELTLTDGMKDLVIICKDGSGMVDLVTSERKNVSFAGQMALLRWNNEGELTFIAVAGGILLESDGYTTEFIPGEELTEISFDKDKAIIETGSITSVKNLKQNGRSVSISSRARKNR